MKKPGRNSRPPARRPSPPSARRPSLPASRKPSRAPERGSDAAWGQGPSRSRPEEPRFIRPEGDPWHFLPDAPREAVARLGFDRPMPIQAAVLASALEGKSFRAIAPTGTGKTLIYLLAAWRILSGGKAKALILVPTRELAYQVTQMLRDLEPTLASASALAIGGHPKEGQLRRLAEGWRILVATPGRLLDFLDEGAVSLRDTGLCVLDEFDKLVGMGFAEQVAAVMRRVPAGAQRLLLSATLAEPEGPDAEGKPAQDAGDGKDANAEAANMAAAAGMAASASSAASAGLAAAAALGLDDLPLLSVDREAGTRSMEEAFYLLKSDKKKSDLLLAELGGARGQAIVFVGNREKANHLNGLLQLRGIGCRVLHGRLRQEERAEAYLAFRRGEFKVLVATDLASRGLDMPSVDLIVNYDLPKHYKDYVHRTGRAARRGRAGRCASFAGPGEYLAMRNLEKEFPGPLPFDPAFAQREAWFRDAKRSHDHKVAQEARADRIRRDQGLDG